MAKDPRIILDEREIARHVTMTVIIRKSRRFRLGLLLIRIGCWMANLGYNEFDSTDGTKWPNLHERIDTGESP